MPVGPRNAARAEAHGSEDVNTTRSTGTAQYVMALVKLIELASCRMGEGTFVEFDGREFAVFRVGDDQVTVMDNACPHASGNLSGGEIDGDVVVCPWHHWEFSLATGLCTHSDRARVAVYPVDIRDGVVWVDVSCSRLPSRGRRPASVSESGRTECTRGFSTICR